MKYRIIYLLICTILAETTAYAQTGKQEVQQFVNRIMKEKAGAFEVAFIPAEQGKDVFELESKHGRIILRGNNGVSIGSALNYYLRHYCHCLITWNGVNMRLPAVLPEVDRKVRCVSPHKYRYYLNYCTFNYSMAWWDWDRWQQEIDWMTLNGINMPLAITGEEAVWDRVYRNMGFSQAQLDSFFCGPSYFAWFWMGNLDGWGGPLSSNWMKSREALQQKIVAAERAMGMTPVLPAFTGHVPPSFSQLFPKARVKRTNWHSGFRDVLILDPSDPMFETIGKKFIEEQTKSYGTDHLYSADTFNENVPPTTDSTYLNDISQKVFTSMAAADPKAVWIMQGWMFHYNRSYWKPTQIQALLNAVPDDRMIILDLYSESFPVWKKTNAYYGKPWIWNMLHNFGGNISLWGRIEPPAKDPAAALRDSASGNMSGIGLTPEAIGQNPALYQLMLENVWSDTAINIDKWLKEYTHQRYGIADQSINKAWTILAKSVYRGGLTEGGPESIITARPTLDSSNRWARTRLDYDPRELIDAWELFCQQIPTLGTSDGFRYDLVDITRQVLANYASHLQQEFAKAFRSKDQEAFLRSSQKFLGLMHDIDRLLATRSDFLLGKWLQDARNNGITSKEKDQYEKNARNLITLWGDQDSPLHDYSCRQWSGLINDFYYPRWQTFINYLKKCLASGMPADFEAIGQMIRKQEWAWVNTHDAGKYPATPVGSETSLVLTLYQKYSSMLKQSF